MLQKNKTRSTFVILVVSVGLTGCADYMNNWDTVTYGSGNAPEANIGIHTVKPFPPAAKNTKIEVEGSKVGDAYKRYREPCDPDVVSCEGGPAG